MQYQAYGTVLQTSVQWPLLTQTSANHRELLIDVETVHELPHGGPVLNRGRLQGRSVCVSGVAPDISVQIDEFLLVRFNKDHRRLCCYATPAAGVQAIEYWLLRQIVPIARLIWAEAEILHAGAVRIGNEAAAFLAPSYTGKSTLVGHFVEQGHTLITDDHLVLRRHEGIRNEPTWVFPSIPYYRNFRALETLGHFTDRYDPEPCRLRVIYVLKRAEPDAPVRISTMSNSEAAIELLYQAPYSLLNLEIPTMLPFARQRFEFVSRLPIVVPVRQLEVPRSLDRLNEVERRIKDDFHRIPGSK